MIFILWHQVVLRHRVTVSEIYGGVPGFSARASCSCGAMHIR